MDRSREWFKLFPYSIKRFAFYTSRNNIKTWLANILREYSLASQSDRAPQSCFYVIKVACLSYGEYSFYRHSTGVLCYLNVETLYNVSNVTCCEYCVVYYINIQVDGPTEDWIPANTDT